MNTDEKKALAEKEAAEAVNETQDSTPNDGADPEGQEDNPANESDDVMEANTIPDPVPTVNAPSVNIIHPAIGRKIWYYPVAGMEQAFDATICYVWNDRCINIAYHDVNGNQAAVLSVLLVQPGDEVPGLDVPYACWMPFQVEQASE